MRSRRLSTVAMLAALLLSSCIGDSNSTHPTDRPLPSGPYTTLMTRSDRMIVQLPNRMIVVAQRIPTAPVASVQVWVKTGSIFERQHNGAGLSHFLEHLLSGGTTSTRSEEESNAILGRIGAQTNAATSLDAVWYYINTSSQHTSTAVDLMSDWMQNSVISQREYERERDVIQSEFAMGEAEPGRILWKLTQQARYDHHPARHPTIGYIDEFMAISRDEIYDFYKTMYVPNNMVFVVAGDIDPRAVVGQVAGLWSKAEAKPVPAILLPVEKPNDQPKQARGEAKIDRPHLRLTWPGTRLAGPHDYALDLLARVLGQGDLSRLVRHVRDEQRLVTSIDAYNASFSWGEGFFGVDAIPAPDKLDEARDAVLAQIERIKEQGVTEDELQRAKRKTIADVVFSAQTADESASEMAGDLIRTGDPDYLKHYAEAIEHVTAAEVKQAAGKFLDPQRLTTIRLDPLTAQPQPMKRTPSASEAAGRKPDVELIDLDNAVLIEKLAARAKEPTATAAAASIEPTKMVTLPNGLRVLVQRNTRLPLVAIQWHQLGGQLADEVGREGLANATMSMLMKGAGDRSADDIARLLESLGARMSAGCGLDTFTAAAECLSGDTPTVLQLMADVVQRPTFPADEWAKMQPRMIAQLAMLNDVWHQHLQNAFREAYFGEHPWSKPIQGTKQVVEAITVDHLRQFHQERLAAAHGVLTVYGDVDPASVIEQVTNLFGPMPGQASKPFEAKAPQLQGGKIVQVSTPSPNIAVRIAYGPGIARTSPDYAPLLVLNRVMSSFPVGRLDQAMRGSEGLAYSVGSAPIVRVVPGYYIVQFNSESTAKAVQGIHRSLAVVEDLRVNPVSEDDLLRARVAVLVREALSRQSNAERAASDATDELYGIGHENSAALIGQIDAVDADAVRRVAEQYLVNPTTVILTNQPIDESSLPAAGGAR